MGKGIVKLGEGQWAVKDGNLLAAKETNGRFKNTEFTVSRGTRASYVGRDGLIKESNLQDVNLVNNGDFSELGSELMPSVASIVNLGGGSITQISSNSYSSTSDGTSGSSVRPKFDFNTTSGKTYKLVITPTGTISGTVNFDFYDGSNYLFNNYDFTTTKEIYFTDNGIVFGSFDGEQTYSVDSFTVSIQQVDPNDYWILGTGWNVEDGVATSTTSGGSSYLTQSGILTSSNTYQITFTVSNYVSGTVKATVSGQEGSSITANGTYTEYLTTTGTDFSIKSQGGTFNGSIDNISIQEVKTDTPRIDFTDNTDGHLLLEPQSTNLITYSEDFSQWTLGSNSTLTYESDVVAPDGSLGVYRLTLPATSSTYIQSPLFTYNNPITLSIYAKYADASNNEFDLYDGTNTTKKITTSEWQRFDAVGFGNQLTIVNHGDTYITDIYIWGGQAEALSYPTSYIPTNGSTVTRDAETCTGAGSSADFNSEEGVLYAEISALANDGTFRMFGISDGTEDNSINLYYRSSFDQITARLKSGGSQEIFENFNITATNFSKVAFRYKSGESNLFIDGIKQKASDYTTTNMPSGLSELAFDGGGNTNFFYGKCKAIRVYKEALGDTDLQNLTS